MHVLLMGFADTILEALDRSLPPRSVTLLEELDVWQARDLEPKAWAHPCFRGLCPAPYQQDEGFLSAVADLHVADAVHAVAPGAEYAVTAAAQAAEALGLPGAGVTAARTLRSKLLLRRAAEAAGMPTPRFREIRSAQDVVDFADGGPCVVKPAERQASLGVVLLEAGGDANAAWRECITADEGVLMARRPMAWRYLVEERLHGPEFSTECLVRDGEVTFLNVTRKRTLTGARPVEVGHVVPGVPDAQLPEWEQAVRDLVAATGFATGMLHAEWIRQDGVPVLVECAGRPPGDRITDLIDLAFGGNLIDRWVRLLAGDPQPPLGGGAGAVRAGAVHYLVPGAGTIQELGGQDRARAVPGVQRVKLLHEPGDEIPAVASSWDRVGYVVAEGATPTQAEQIARSAASLINVRMSPPDADGPGDAVDTVGPVDTVQALASVQRSAR